MRASLNGMLVVVVGTDAPADYGRQLAEGAQAAFACWLSALSQFAIPETVICAPVYLMTARLAVVPSRPSTDTLPRSGCLTL